MLFDKKRKEIDEFSTSMRLSKCSKTIVTHHQPIVLYVLIGTVQSLINHEKHYQTHLVIDSFHFTHRVNANVM